MFLLLAHDETAPIQRPVVGKHLDRRGWTGGRAVAIGRTVAGPSMAMNSAHRGLSRLPESGLEVGVSIGGGVLGSDVRRITGNEGMAYSIFGMVVSGFAIQLRFSILISLGADLAVGGSLAAVTLIALLGRIALFVRPINEVGEFDDIHFGYTDTPVVNGLTFDVPARSMTSIVGPSGSGKTTVTRLTARFWDIDIGSVRVGGVHTSHYGAKTAVRLRRTLDPETGSTSTQHFELGSGGSYPTCKHAVRGSFDAHRSCRWRSRVPETVWRDPAIPGHAIQRVGLGGGFARTSPTREPTVPILRPITSNPPACTLAVRGIGC